MKKELREIYDTVQTTRADGQEFKRGRFAWEMNGCGETSEFIKIGDAYVSISICQGGQTWINMAHDDGDGRQKSFPCVLDLGDVRENSSLLMEA